MPMTGGERNVTNGDLRKDIYTRYGRDFQDVGETFDPASAGRWGRAYRWYLRGWLPVRNDAPIAELGCGYGRLLHFLKLCGYTNLQGVDISTDQVAVAKQVVSAVTQANVLDWLSEHPQTFDLLVALDLIEHLTREEALRFIALCFEALRPGGRLILQTPNADSPFGMQHRFNDITHEWAYNCNQLSRLLKRAGFVGVHAREQGPVPWGYSVASTARWVIWQTIRAGLQVWNLAETGTIPPALTRVILISGRKG